MERAVISNNRGFSLVEVMVAMMILLMVSLALMQTALLSINANMRNALRDEAVAIAEGAMDGARNTPYGSLAGVANTPVLRDVRKQAGFDFTISNTVSTLGGGAKRVDVRVEWAWKGETFDHTISTVVGD